MNKVVDYYFSPMSPWTYLGHARFAAMAGKHGASINVKPVDLGRIFPSSGGLPLAKRAPQRQAYRLVAGAIISSFPSQFSQNSFRTTRNWPPTSSSRRKIMP